MDSSSCVIGREFNEGDADKGVGREIHPPKSFSFLSPISCWCTLFEIWRNSKRCSLGNHTKFQYWPKFKSYIDSNLYIALYLKRWLFSSVFILTVVYFWRRKVGHDLRNQADHTSFPLGGVLSEFLMGTLVIKTK